MKGSPLKLPVAFSSNCCGVYVYMASRKDQHWQCVILVVLSICVPVYVCVCVWQKINVGRLGLIMQGLHSRSKQSSDNANTTYS